MAATLLVAFPNKVPSGAPPNEKEGDRVRQRVTALNKEGARTAAAHGRRETEHPRTHILGRGELKSK